MKFSRVISFGWIACALFTAFDASAAIKKVTIALTEEPPNLNSAKSTDQVSFFVLGHVMEGLTRNGPKGRIVPGVAKKWDIRDDGATFWLRKDAKWSDGKPVTAKDFLFGWQTALDPKTASEYAFILYPIKNAEAINTGKKPLSSLGVKVVNDYQIEIQFEKPCGYFLGLTAFGTYLPIREDFYKSRKGKYAANHTDMLYNGPFKLTKWVHGASLRFEKNENYWNKKKIKLDMIDVPYITADTHARFNLFKDGKIDFVGLDSETMKSAIKERLRIRKFSDGALFYNEYNHRPGRVTANKNLRKALQFAFDPKELVDKVIAIPGNLPGRSIFPVWLKGPKTTFRKDFPVKIVKQDIPRAKKYLAKALKELGVTKLPPLVLLTGSSPTASKQAEYFQNLYKKTLNIDIKIDKQTFKQRLAKMTAGEFDIVAAGWGPDYDDPMTFADLFASWNENNRGRFKNKAYDAAIRKAQATSDPKVRMEAMAEAQRIAAEELPVLPSYERGNVYVQASYLKGMGRSVIGADPDFTTARVTKKRK